MIPKNSVLEIPVIRSSRETQPLMLSMKRVGLTLSSIWEIIIAPPMPARLDMTASSGKDIMHAISLGETSFLIGSAPRVLMASICSVTFIELISAVMPEPTLPPTRREVIIGPSSLTNESVTTGPTSPFAPNQANPHAICTTITIPIAMAETTTIEMERKPISCIWAVRRP